MSLNWFVFFLTDEKVNSEITAELLLKAIPIGLNNISQKDLWSCELLINWREYLIKYWL